MVPLLSCGYKHYYELPPEQLIAIDCVMETFKLAAIRYQTEHDKMLSVFIDGIDLLAENNPDVFLRLISHAKIFVNQLIARIIFISSEGSIMPILKSTSAMNRSMTLIEVGDIPEVEAVQYLISKGLGEEDAQHLANFFGGRFVYLNACVAINRRFQKLGMPVDVEQIKREITERKINEQRGIIMKNEHATHILKEISRRGAVLPSDLITDEIGRLTNA